MLVVDELPVDGYEKVVHITDTKVDMNGFIAVHSTVSGPSLGGLRIRQYPSEETALRDVLRLAEAMTYKAAAAGLPFGGGKAVLIGDPATLKNAHLLEQYGRAVDRLDGAYVTAEDVGTTVDDLAVVAQSTKWVAGLPAEQGGSGDPSPATARGVLTAMKAVAHHMTQSGSLHDWSVLVQGLGKVGSELVSLLVEEEAHVVVTDIDSSLVDKTRSECEDLSVATPEAFIEDAVDILSPCALGGLFTAETVPRLQCRAIVGSANNQLESPEIARLLADAGIIYAPDFIANAGGIINIASEFGYTKADVESAIAGIADTTTEILQRAEASNTTTHEAAMDFARARLSTAATP